MSEGSEPKPPSETQPAAAGQEETPRATASPQAEETTPADEPPSAKAPETEVAAKPKAAQETEVGAKPKKAPKKAKEVTSKVLRAAARSTADIKDILAAEARVRKKQSNAQSSVFARAQEMHESGMGKVEGAPATAQPKARPPAPTERDGSAQVRARTARNASAGPGSPRAPSTAQTGITPPPTQATRSARATPGPAKPDAPALPLAPRFSSSCPLIALAASVFAAGLMVAWSLHGQTAALRALAERPEGRTPSLPDTPRGVEPPSPEPNRTRGVLAEVGVGRVVYADGSGRLVVLQCDPGSAELEVERVYELVYDEERGQGQPDRLYHGYYLDDLDGQRKDAVKTAHDRYEAAVTHAARTYTGVDEADAAAVALVAAGGADRLVQFLDPEASALRRRTAVVGLAEGGYLCAVKPLLGLLGDHIRNAKFFARLARLASHLTGQELDPSNPEGVLDGVRTWMATNTDLAPFARVKGS